MLNLSERLGRLAGKYERLVELHHALERWDDARAARLDRPLAQEFPGALRELQTLGVAELESRARALRSASQGGPVEPWMVWMSDYHQLLALGLDLRRRLGRQAVRAAHAAEETAAGLAVELAGTAPLPLDAAFIQALLRPPGGRIAPVVIARLAEHHAVPPSTLAAAVRPAVQRSLRAAEEVLDPGRS